MANPGACELVVADKLPGSLSRRDTLETLRA